MKKIDWYQLNKFTENRMFEQVKKREKSLVGVSTRKNLTLSDRISYTSRREVKNFLSINHKPIKKWRS